MIGKTVSHYRITEQIGSGGMGVVYKAEDTKLKRTVALKFLHPELTRDPEAKARFIREAQAASALEHPNICNIHEIGETDDGQLFIVMACYEGQTLKEKISSGPLLVEDAIDIAIQISEGLAKAHEKGMVHRDIKPANILITTDGIVKILDFGLAKLAGQAQLTKDSSTLGTVAYMSPEQCSGREVDHRTDIWSFGVMVYEMLTGGLPFPGDYEQAIIYAILNEEPKALEIIPSQLQGVVRKALCKNPEDRYQTIKELLNELNQIKSNLIILPENKPILAKIGTFINNNIAVVLIPIILTLAVIAVIYFIQTEPTIETSHIKRLVVLPFENLSASEDEYFADGITEEITSRLATLKGLGVISRTSALHYKNADKTIRQIGKELNVDYILEGTVRWQHSGEDESRVRITPQLIRVSDDTHLWSEPYDRVFQDIFSIQSEIAKQIVQQLDITLSESENKAIQVKPTDNLVAYKAYLQGLDYLKYSHAPEDQYCKAQKMFEQAIELDPNFTLAYVKLSETHRSLYFFGYDHTSERLKKTKEAVDKALKLQPRLPAVHVALGYYYYQGHLDYDKALKEFSIAAKSLPNDNELLANIAYVWRRQGLFEQAINNLEYALTLSPNNAMLMAELAQSYLSIRKYEDAVRYCDQCIGIAPDNKWAYLIKVLCYWCWQEDIVSARSVLEDMPDKGSPYSILFLYLQEIYERDYQGSLDRLSTLSGELIEVQSAFTPKSLLAGWAYSLLNDSLHAKSSFESARILLEEALQEQSDDPRVHSSLGLVYAGLGRKEEAIREGKKAMELYPVSKDALLGTNRIMDLISIYVMTGSYDDAIDQITYLLSIPSYHSINYFRLIPRMDPLRKLPRFQKLVERYSGSDL